MLVNSQVHKVKPASFVPVEEALIDWDPEFVKQYVKEPKDKDAFPDATSIKKIESQKAIVNPSNAPLGQRDRGFFSCIRNAPRLSHGFCVYWVEFSPSGNLLASCGHDGQVKVWDPQNFQELKRFEGHQSPALQCTFTKKNEDYVVSLSVTEIMVWYMETPKGASNSKLVILGHKGLSTFSISPDDSLLIFSGENALIRVWNFQKSMSPQFNNPRPREYNKDEHLLFLLPTKDGTGHQEKVTRIVFSPADRMYFLTASYDKSIVLWHVKKESQGPSRKFLGHKDHVLGLNWHSDGLTFCSSGHDSLIFIWRTDQPTPIHKLKKQQGIIYACAFLPKSNRLLTVGNSDYMYLWDTTSGKLKARIPHAQEGWRTCCAIHPKDGLQIAVGGNSKTLPIVLWQADRPPPLWKRAVRLLCFWLPGSILTLKRAFQPEGGLQNDKQQVDIESSLPTTAPAFAK